MKKALFLAAALLCGAQANALTIQRILHTNRPPATIENRLENAIVPALAYSPEPGRMP